VDVCSFDHHSSIKLISYKVSFVTHALRCFSIYDSFVSISFSSYDIQSLKLPTYSFTSSNPAICNASTLGHAEIPEPQEAIIVSYSFKLAKCACNASFDFQLPSSSSMSAQKKFLAPGICPALSYNGSVLPR